MKKRFYQVIGFFALSALLVSCSTPAARTTNDGAFPVRVVSGNVRILTTGQLKGDSSLNWSGLRFSRAILSGKENADASDFPAIGEGESIVIEIIAIDASAVVEASGKRYTLTKAKPRLRLVYTP